MWTTCGRRTGVFAAILCVVAVAATPAWAVVLLQQNFEDPLPGSASNGPGSYVVVNDPSPGWQIQGGTDGAGSVTLTAGVDANGVSGSQALFGNWDTTLGAVYTWNQYSIYGVPGSASAVPLNRVEVSLDLFVSGFENAAAMVGIRYQAGGEVAFTTPPTNNAYKHVVFTLDQATGTAPDTTLAFNLRVEHGADGFGFDANNILRIDNLQVQTLDIPVVLGDYNGNGTVDAADYVVWRDNPASLINEGASIGMVDQADYDFWKANFGQPAVGSGAIVAGAVPEPGALSLLAIAAAAGVMRFTNRRHGCASARNC